MREALQYCGLYIFSPLLLPACVCAGLHSSRVGEQCEAIVKFPVLVDRFPFPILINAAFLKLADVFRNG